MFESIITMLLCKALNIYRLKATSQKLAVYLKEVNKQGYFDVFILPSKMTNVPRSNFNLFGSAGIIGNHIKY